MHGGREHGVARAAARGRQCHAAVQDRAASGHRDLPRRLRGLRRRALRAAWALGLRQVDAVEGGRGFHAAGRGTDAPRRRADRPAWLRPHDGVPGVRPAAAVEDRARQRAVPAAEQPAHAQGRGDRARARRDRQGEPLEIRERLSAHAVRRHEAARRDRARARDGAEGAADGRAVRGARRADAAQDAGRAEGAVGRCRLHGAVRHPLDRGGAAGRQPHPRACRPTPAA